MSQKLLVAALDSFKGSLSSLQAGEAVAQGFTSGSPRWRATAVPIADGGEGTIHALLAAGIGEKRSVRVVDLLGNLVNVPLLVERQQNLAVIESASVVGLPADPKQVPGLYSTASTYGLGQAAWKAHEQFGVKEVIISLGGTGTTDGGAGLLLALGARLRNLRGTPITHQPGRNPLLDDTRLVTLPRLPFKLTAWTDVSHPLVGPSGAAPTFGPQKGLNSSQVSHADLLLTTLGRALSKASGQDVLQVPGGGAAGGLGAALLALGAPLVNGFVATAAWTGLEGHLAKADLVITGEGKFDEQTSHGKVPSGVAQLAGKYDVPTILLAGSVPLVLPKPESGDPSAFLAVFPIQSGPVSRKKARDPRTAAANLRRTASQIASVLEV